MKLDHFIPILVLAGFKNNNWIFKERKIKPKVIHLLTGWIFLLLFAISLNPSFSQVIPDNNGTSSVQPTSNGNFFTIPGFTIPPGKDALLVVMTRTGGNTNITQVSFNGTTYTTNKVGSGGTSLKSEMWAIPLGDIAASISSDIVVTLSANNFNRGGIAASYKNVNQTEPVVNFVAQNSPNASSSSTISISSMTGDMVVDALATLEPSGAASYTAGASQTQVASTIPINSAAAQKLSMSQELSSGSSVSPSWMISGTANAIMHIGANIQAVYSQVLPDNNGTSSIQPTSNGNTFTIPNFTISAGKDALLVVMTRTGGNTSVTQISFNGTNYTSNQVGSGGTTLKSEMWAIPLGDIAATIISDIVVTISANNFNRGGIAASYKNVNQAEPAINFESQFSPSGSGSSTITISSARGDMVLDALAAQETSGSLTYTPGIGQTQVGATTTINTGGNQKISMSQELSSGNSVAPAWTISGSANAIMHIGANIQSVVSQVEPDNNGTSSIQPIGNGNTFTIPNFTIPVGKDALLVVMTRTGGSTSITQVSFNGIIFTTNQIGSGGSPLTSSMWAIPLGDISSTIISDIVVTLSGNDFNRGGIAASYKNVNQAQPVVNFVSQGAPNGSGSSSISIASKRGDMIVDALATFEPSSPATYTPGTTQTQVGSTAPVNAGSKHKISMSQVLSSGNLVSPSWTITGNASAIRHIGASIQAARGCDNVNPPLAFCQTATVNLDAYGSAMLDARVIDQGSNDGCGILTYSASPSLFDCDDVGPNSVVLTVTDQCGMTASCITTLTIQDNIAPVITITGDNPFKICQGETYIDPGSNYADNCAMSGAATGNTASVNTSVPGTYYVTYDYTDPNGNAAIQGSREVIVGSNSAALAQQGCGSCGQIRSNTCQFDPSPDLDAYVMANANYEAGATLNWYDENNSPLPGAPTVNTAQSSTKWYLVEQQGDCGPGPAIQVRVRVKKQFAPEFSLPAIGCGAGTGQIDLAAWVSDPKNKTTRYTFYDVDPNANPGATPIGTVKATKGVVNFGQHVIVNVLLGTQTYWVKNKVPNGCGGTASSTLIANSVNATLNFIPNLNVHNGTPVNLAFSGTNVTNIYWIDHPVFSNPNIGIVGMMGLNSMSFTAFNPTSGPLTATIRVIAYNGNCAGQFQDFSITVQPGSPTRQANNQLQLFASMIHTHEVQVDWKITSEDELIRFEIEKKQNDGRFEAIGYLDWKGNDAYQYTDESGMSKVNHYRLKLVYADGRIVWSETVEVNMDFMGDDRFSVFPNPSTDKFQLKALFPLDETYNWQLVDLMGKVVKSGSLQQQEMMVTTSGLAEGLYHLKVVSEAGKKYNKKLIIH